ncbi:FAD-dependent oxidoreductase [uncultured Tateyamaria sp.]|uniref:flavin monoamine oxidase family protein n=1 Tax=uncultured Tateyamaria sp. TaxID=455651 RepID=UPI00261ECD13|nr:FAD-dependent oxidoreductase [uncultured Tateyamaria sp.]
MTTLIIGGGLSGLALAHALEKDGRDYLLLEARDRFGGRILTQDVGDGQFDLGPAWFWPGQPRIAALINELGLKRFDQYADGILTFEDETGQVQRGRGFASMEGSWRLQGGIGRLTQALAARIPHHRKRLNAVVTALHNDTAGIRAVLSDGETHTADRAVLAMPPRIAAELQYVPALADRTRDDMRAVPTWMAGQAKAVAVYDTPFWRDAGLSGDAMSRRGPLAEIHDASPASDGPFALFGFIGVPANARGDVDQLRTHVLAQLVRLFGKEAETPRQLLIKDWAYDPLTSTAADQKPLFAHPSYRLSTAMTGLFDGRLILSGTETAAQFGGYLEGALEAAENALDQIKGSQLQNQRVG